jgi:hypothetical protein
MTNASQPTLFTLPPSTDESREIPDLSTSQVAVYNFKNPHEMVPNVVWYIASLDYEPKWGGTPGVALRTVPGLNQIMHATLYSGLRGSIIHDYTYPMPGDHSDARTRAENIIQAHYNITEPFHRAREWQDGWHNYGKCLSCNMWWNWPSVAAGRIPCPLCTRPLVAGSPGAAIVQPLPACLPEKPY